MVSKKFTLLEWLNIYKTAKMISNGTIKDFNRALDSIITVLSHA